MYTKFLTLVLVLFTTLSYGQPNQGGGPFPMPGGTVSSAAVSNAITGTPLSLSALIVSNDTTTVGLGSTNFFQLNRTNTSPPIFNITSNGLSFFGFPLITKSSLTNSGGLYVSSTAFFDGITISNSGPAYGIGSTNIFEVRNTNSGALPPSLAVSTNGLVYGNTLWSIIGFAGSSLTTTTNYGYIVGGTLTTTAGDITNKAVKLGRDVYISWFNCRVGAAPVGGTNYTFTVTTNGNLSGIGVVITGNGVNQEGSATFNPAIKIPANTLMSISIVASATGPGAMSTSWAFGQ